MNSNNVKTAPVKPTVKYADKLTPVLAIPEKPVPSGTRAG